MSALKKTTGFAIATAAAALLATGCNSNPGHSGGAMGKSEAKVKCAGVNSCKGKGACGMANHDCAGKNACKGKGWVMMDKGDCSAKGGKVHK